MKNVEIRADWLSRHMADLDRRLARKERRNAELRTYIVWLEDFVCDSFGSEDRGEKGRDKIREEYERVSGTRIGLGAVVSITMEDDESA